MAHSSSAAPVMPVAKTRSRSRCSFCSATLLASCFIRRMHSAIEYAPLVPGLAAILLTHMPEAHAYVTLREMVCDHSQFLPPSKVDHYSYCRAFAQLLKRLHPETARQMEDTGALTPRGLDPIFRRFFVTLLRHDHVLRIMDIYTIEGAKVLFRFGVALIAMHKSELKAAAAKGRGADAQTFWTTLRDYAHSRRFDFNALVKKAYGSVGSKWRRVGTNAPANMGRHLREGEVGVTPKPAIIDATMPRHIAT